MITKSSKGFGEWKWPEDEHHLFSVTFGDVVKNDKAFPYLDHQRVMIQAGGACGVWPFWYAEHFEHVYTFEPVAGNWECLQANISCPSSEHYRNNITAYNLALSECEEELCFEKAQSGNAGSWQPARNETDYKVKATTIDQLNLPVVDLIQLDIQGWELKALLGAQRTIGKCRPILQLELVDKKYLPTKPQPCKDWLGSIGYKLVRSVGKDTLWVPGP